MGLSVMKKKGTEDDELLRDGRVVKTMKGDTVGTEYRLHSGPLNTRVTVRKEMPDVHEVRVPGKAMKTMSKSELKNYITSGSYAEDSSIPELMMKSNLSKAQQEDVKKIKSNK